MSRNGMGVPEPAKAETPEAQNQIGSDMLDTNIFIHSNKSVGFSGFYCIVFDMQVDKCDRENCEFLEHCGCME